MPYKLTWEAAGGVYRRYHGDVTIAERRESFDAICSDRRFDGLRYTITDSLAVARYEVTPQANAEIAALHVGPLMTNPGIVIAAVATRPDIVEAIRNFIGHGFTPQTPYEIFPTVAEARAWVATQLKLPRRRMVSPLWRL